MKKSLHLKLVLIMILLVISVMVVVGEYLIISVGVYYENSFKEQMRQVFTADTQGALSDGAAKGTDELKDRLSAYSGRLGIATGTDRDFYILDQKTGKYLAGGEFSSGKTPALTKNIIAAMNGKVGSGNSITDSYFDIAIPVTGGDRDYIVYIRDSKTASNELVWLLMVIILQAMLFGLLVSFLLSFLLSKTISKPIEELTSGAKRIAAGDFGYELTVRSTDEIGVLTSTFNDMANVLNTTIEAVKDERNKYSSLLIHMTDGVAAFDTRGYMLHINPAAEEMLCFGKEDGTDYHTLFGATGVSIDDVMAQAPSGHVEAVMENRVGYLRMFMSPFGSKDADRGIIIVIHNITEQKKLDDSRREFVANVSHELRTPLTSIKGYAETILDDTQMEQNVRSNFLSVIINESDRMMRIVKDLLMLTRIDNRHMNWNFEWTDMEKLLSDINTAMQIRAAEQRHTLTAEIKSPLPAVWCDKQRIEQVFVNILSNAINYTPPGGRISLSASHVRGQVTVNVTDNGIGIPTEDIPHLFDRFYRVDKARSRETGGTGLGLAIAKEIMDKHSGHILVDSTPGMGTTISLILPVNCGEDQNGGDAGNAEEKGLL